jgi:hypothetical protein
MNYIQCQQDSIPESRLVPYVLRTVEERQIFSNATAGS